MIDRENSKKLEKKLKDKSTDTDNKKKKSYKKQDKEYTMI